MMSRYVNSRSRKTHWTTSSHPLRDRIDAFTRYEGQRFNFWIVTE